MTHKSRSQNPHSIHCKCLQQEGKKRYLIFPTLSKISTIISLATFFVSIGTLIIVSLFMQQGAPVRGQVSFLDNPDADPLVIHFWIDGQTGEPMSLVEPYCIDTGVRLQLREGDKYHFFHILRHPRYDGESVEGITFGIFDGQ